MNSPVDHQPDNPALDTRVSKLEVACEHLVAEFREFREEMRAFRAEMREEMRTFRAEMRADMREMREDQRDLRRSTTTDFRILFGAIITVVAGSEP